MSRASRGSRPNNPNNHNNPEFRNFETVDFVPNTKINFSPLLTMRPEFTIKKRPQSFSNLQKERAKSSAGKKRSPERSTIGTHVSKPFFRMDSNLYVPGLHSSRSRR